MARIRSIKPEFWTDEDIAMLDDKTKLLAIGLLNHSDDEGYFKAHEALVKAAVFPFSDQSLSVHGLLKQLEKSRYLTLFTGTDGKQYGHILNFTQHQKVNRPNPSKIKGFKPITDNSVSDHGQITGGKEQGTGSREQGTGNEKQETTTPDGGLDDYAFHGEQFNVNQKDFQRHKELFPNLDLISEYPQLDLELRDTPKKQIWGALNAKLNYRNKNGKPGNQFTSQPKLSTIEQATLHNAAYAAELQRQIDASPPAGDDQALAALNR